METPFISHFTIDKILEKKCDEQGLPLYKVLWHGKAAEEASWVPANKLQKVQSLISQFESSSNAIVKKAADQNFNLCTIRKKKYFILKTNFDRLRKLKKEREKIHFPVENEMEFEESEFSEEYSTAELQPFFIHRNFPSDLKIYLNKGDERKPQEPIAINPSTTNKKPSSDPLDKEKILDLPLYGNFSFGDFPEKVLECVYRENSFLFKVEWKPRKNGYRPYPTFVSNDELKENDPKFLISFYESKIRVIKQYN